MHYWYIRYNMIEISEKILKFQQCVPSQSPTNHPICCHLVYHCLCTEKKISQFKWNFDKTLPIISIRLNAAEPYIFSRNNFHFFRHILSCRAKTSKHMVKENIGQFNHSLWPSFAQQNIFDKLNRFLRYHQTMVQKWWNSAFHHWRILISRYLTNLFSLSKIFCSAKLEQSIHMNCSISFLVKCLLVLAVQDKMLRQWWTRSGRIAL